MGSEKAVQLVGKTDARRAASTASQRVGRKGDLLVFS
jgi:hypothetical protein